MEARLGCSRIVLTLDETTVDKNRIEIGPFNKKVAERWLAELKKIIGNSAQQTGINRNKAKSA